MEVESEATLLLTYRCPRCRIALTARTEQWSTWLRCPKCGRASLPPDDGTLPAHVRPKDAEDIHVIGAKGPPVLTPLFPGSARRRSALTGSARRILLVTGLFLSLIILVFSVLDQHRLNASIFAFAALVFIGLLLLPAKR